MSKTNIFFSHLEGTRIEKQQQIFRSLVLAKKKLEGPQILSLGYPRPVQEIVYLPPETTLADAKSEIIRVSYALIMVGLQPLSK